VENASVDGDAHPKFKLFNSIRSQTMNSRTSRSKLIHERQRKSSDFVLLPRSSSLDCELDEEEAKLLTPQE
jgi:hypothetical protein